MSLRMSVSDLLCYQYYRDSEDASLEDCLAQLRRERPPTPAMQAGSALHAILEHAQDGEEMFAVERDGFRFTFDCEVDLSVPQVRELKGEIEVETPSGSVTLVGVVDTIDGTVGDYKLTGRFDAEKYAESYQWRCYLQMFNRSKFVYKVFVGKEDTPGAWVIREYHELPVYRYSSMETDVQREIEECARFLRQQGLR